MKKALSVLLCVLMVAGVLAGCGNTAGGGAAADPTSADTAGGEDAGAEASLGEKPAVLRVLMPFQNYDTNTDPTALAAESATGYKVNYEMLPAEDPEAKLNAIIAAQDDYDMMMLTTTLFSNTIATGAYKPLDELLDQYAPRVKEVTDPSLFMNVTMNGEILAIPEGTSSAGFAGTVIRGRKDMFAAVGYENMPTTLDDFYDACVKLRDEQNVIPLSLYRVVSVIQEIGSAFGVYSPSFNVVGEELKYYIETPGMLEYVTFMNKMFNEGLLDGEFASIQAAQTNEKFFTGKAAMYYMAYWNEPSATSTIMEAFPEAELAYLPPLTDGDKGGYEKSRGMNRAMVFPKVGKNTEHALNWVNLKLDEDTFRFIAIGEEGVHYTQNGDTLEPIQPAFADERNNSSHYVSGTRSEDYGYYWVETRTKKDMTLYQTLMDSTASTFTVPNYFPVTSFLPPIDEYNKNAPTAAAYASDSVLQFICGTRPLTEWDAFIEEWKTQYSGQAVLDAIGGWWAENKTEVIAAMNCDPL